jgi:nucleotide-binding universal stress UspA family protein
MDPHERLLMSFNKILVPVDFSTCSGAALDYALMLQRELGAEVEVLHAFEIPAFVPPHVVVMMGEVEASLADHAEQAAKRELDAFLERHGAKGNTPRGVYLGPPGLVVLERLESGGVDLVVMGTHGRTGLARWVMGSTAEKVLRGSKCPVLTIRSDEGA